MNIIGLLMIAMIAYTTFDLVRMVTDDDRKQEGK
tara:strand:- start:143 stop:244 length:102 start_codon:yes stop_codon:yes gene_type:complete